MHLRGPGEVFSVRTMELGNFHWVPSIKERQSKAEGN